MAGAGVAMRDNPWAAFANPGCLAVFDERILSVSYTPQPFGLKELSRAAFSYIEPTSIGTFAVSGSRFGFGLYREVDIQLAFSLPISGMFSAGGSLHYYHLGIERYGSAQTVGADIGLVAELSGQLQWGFAAFNVNAPSIGAARERLPQVFSTGLVYFPVPDAAIAADLEKDIRFPVEVHLGMQYRLLDLLSLRVGTIAEPSMFSAGIGLRLSFAGFDYSFTNHSDLGPTHGFSLSIHLGEL